MESFITFTNQSQGRDRIFRATQYACVLVKYLLRKDSTRKELLQKLRSLESNMSSGRKLFRLGNTVNSIDAAKKTLYLSDPVLRLCLTVANINRALYFICDNVLWARSLGFLKGIDKERWNLNANRYYFFSLVMNLTRDVYVIAQLMVQRSRERQFQQKVNQHLNESPDVACVIIPQLDAFLFLLIESLKNHPAVALDTIKNACDLFIPLDKLGIYQTNAGVVGMCGLVSSLIGILSVLKTSLKMKP
ncbi:peroxisomal membrane protein 11A [Astyanax mexicanus]|uniref:Peroxisomal biosis factor 11 alpha n=1 Tax=Astyanax mexicanus TaxID=7994 RepID=A0A8B9K261_ASTMX|nr:peroxisomal membrane protein 11A [Astyanax mexicanus]KAG9273275.1 peroxisomal membrane protein 11A [Astyanax mexicanus]